jgi:hypothetical protein
MGKNPFGQTCRNHAASGRQCRQASIIIVAPQVKPHDPDNRSRKQAKYLPLRA